MDKQVVYAAYFLVMKKEYIINACNMDKSQNLPLR